MSNKILLGNEGRQALKKGIDQVFNVVAPTLGANGRNVVFNKWSKVPIFSNDGVSVARLVEPEDQTELQGANLIKQVCERTNDEAGDGTSTSVVLAHAIISEGLNSIEASNKNLNLMNLRREIQAASSQVVEIIKDTAIPVKELSDLQKVATISVEDATIGSVIAEAVYNAGDTGQVYVNESEEIGVSCETVEGYLVHQGLVTPWLVTNTDKMQSELENVAILMTELPLHFNAQFQSLIEAIRKTTNNILIIADEIHPQVIQFAVANTREKKFKMAIIKKPMRANSLEDLSALVGGKVLTKDLGEIVPKFSHLGFCRKAVVGMKTTTIIDGFNPQEETNKYIDSLKAQIEEATDEPSKTKLQERLAELTQGIFMVNVGANTEGEAKYLKMKVDDAVNATIAARKEGIVAGGGVTLYRISKSLFDSPTLTDGEIIVRNALQAPLKQIIKNSGVAFEDIETQINTSKTSGFNAANLSIVPDMIEDGIVDPAFVTRKAFENASGFASLFLTTEAVISPIPQPIDLPPVLN